MASSLKRNVDRFHRANHHLSTRTSQIMVVRCSSQKPYSTNIAKSITGTVCTNNNTQQMSYANITSGHEFFKCHGGKYVSRNHTVKHLQKKSLGPLHEKGSIKSTIYNCHGGIIIKKRHRTKVAMPVKNTLEKSCQTKFLKQRPSKIMVV